MTDTHTVGKYTHIAVLVDRSGSMWGIKDDMVGGLNEFFKGQSKVEGDCLVDYAQFDTLFEQVYTDVPVSKAKAVIEPRGGTALLDSIGKTINDLKSRIKNKPKSVRPDNVLVVIVTDGMENSSREFKSEDIKAMIKDRESKGWEFVFLGANMDAVSVAQDFGIKAGSALTYNTTTSGIGATSQVLSNYTTMFRGAGSASFSDEDRKAAGGDA